MKLADAGKHLALSPEKLRAFGSRLRAVGLTAARAKPIVGVGQELPNGSRRAIRAFHARRLRDAGGTAMRMLLINDPVTREEAREAMGALFNDLVEAELLVEVAGGRIVSPYVLGIVGDLYVLCDDLALGGEAVMGQGGTTVQLCCAALPERRIGRALDLGCGAGTAALTLARHAEHVVGTDISARAVALSRANAAINGIGNVEFREGDLFAPVAGETFDLIVSQPPFISRPEGAEGVTFLYGGARGDELSLRLLAELPPYVAPGGRAVLLIEWPVAADAQGPASSDLATPVGTRVRNALHADELDLLVLECPPTPADQHAVGYAAMSHPTLDAAFEEDVIRRRENLDRLGIGGLTLTLTVLERPLNPARGWTSVVPVQPLASLWVTSGRLDKMFAARAIAESATPERLLEATLRVPDGTTLSEEQDGPGADRPSRIEARFSREALLPPITLTVEMLGLLTLVHEAPSVREGMAAYAEALEIPFDAALSRALPSVRAALVDGLLEVSSR